MDSPSYSLFWTEMRDGFPAFDSTFYLLYEAIPFCMWCFNLCNKISETNSRGKILDPTEQLSRRGLQYNKIRILRPPKIDFAV